MSPQLPSQLWVAILATAGLLNLALPVLVAVWAQHRFGGRVRVFFLGAAVFAVSQLLLRIPLITVGQVLLRPALEASASAQWAWLGLLALSAGLFEETGRWLGWRFLLRSTPRDLGNAVRFGLGHGGVEAVVLIGLSQLATAASMLWLFQGGLDGLPAEAREPALRQLAAIAAQPDWTPLLSVWERLSSLAVHVSLSVAVALGVRTARLGWLLGAIAFHALTNFVAAGFLQVYGGATWVIVTTEVLIMGLALAGLLFVHRFAPRLAP